MAFRRFKNILALAIIGWITVLGYLAFTDFGRCGTETNQLHRAKRVLDKSHLFIDNLQTEIRSLQDQISNLQKKCKKKCPLVRPTVQMKDSPSQSTHPARATSTRPSHERREPQGNSNAPKNASVARFEHKVEAPNLKLEIIRRRAMKELREIWYYLSAEVTKINKLLGSSLKARLTTMLDNFAEMHRTLGNNLDRINNHDALLTWRREEQAKLSKLVRNRLNRLQNPKDCDAARKLICDLNKGCGYGCQVHHLLYCFITAYGANRTLIINSYGWRYSEKGWEGVFVPASNTCTIAKGQHEMWSVNSGNSKNVQLPIVDGLYPQPKHLPLAVPRDLVERIQSFHGFPFVWWIGQFAKYLFQYQPKIKQEIDEKKLKLGFQTPIVG